MATHSSILALEIPWTEEPSGIQSMYPSGIQAESDTIWHTCTHTPHTTDTHTHHSFPHLMTGRPEN